MDVSGVFGTRDNDDLLAKDGRDLLDIIDRLRSQGINHFVDLPQIIVCGDQSSGKSSVLEAISRKTFPTKDSLCTRFATELILRRSTSESINIRIIPDPTRPQAEREKLESFTRSQANLDLGEVVNDAQIAMGLNEKGKGFGTDVLRVELSGPRQPHLTMVDLPGLFLAANKDQSAEDAALVQSLVLSYMTKPRSIILAVVSAKNEFALQQVTQHARGLDPEGLRTLGLITKPDTLDKDSDSERFYVNLAQNKDVKFRLGWHVLRNRSFETRNVSIQQRDVLEAEFFSKGVWASLLQSQLGVSALKMRLSNVLKDHILNMLPSVIGDVETEIKICKNTLAKLGESRSTFSEQERYLVKVSTGFSSVLRAAIDGIYIDPFFSGTSDSGACQRRLRAVVQNRLSMFAQTMRIDGQAKVIKDETAVQASHGPRIITRSEYIKEVKGFMKERRGRELPGTYNPLIVAELFNQHCKPWQRLVHDTTQEIFDSTYTTIVSIVQHFTDEETSEEIIRGIIGPSMENLKRNLFAKIEELLEPHLSGHPITYNHYLTENIQKAQIDRYRGNLKNQLDTFFRDRTYNGFQWNEAAKNKLLQTVVSSTVSNMDDYSANMATDVMEAYYKVDSPIPGSPKLG